MRRFVLFLCVLASLLAVMLYLNADTAAYRRSEDAMYRNRAVLELHFREHGRYPPTPATGLLRDLVGDLNRSGRGVVTVDGWDHLLRYVASPDGKHYFLISPGKNGVVEYRASTAERDRGMHQDVVIADGEFFSFWEGRTYCPRTCRTTSNAYLECEARGGEVCVENLPRRCDEYDHDVGARTTTAPRPPSN